MPLQGEFHTFFWENSDTSVAPVRVTRGGYPVWQASVITLGFGFGGLLPWWERLIDRLGWFWLVFRRTVRLDRERRLTVIKVIEALEHATYPTAQRSVRKTATTLGFNRPESWKELSRSLKSEPGQAENAFRHLEACRLVKVNQVTSTLTNPQLHLMVELAYQGFGILGK